MKALLLAIALVFAAPVVPQFATSVVYAQDGGEMSEAKAEQAAEASAEKSNSSVEKLMEKIPYNAMGWVFAIFAFLQALQTFLSFLAAKLDKDPKHSSLFEKGVAALGKILGLASKAVRFLTANNK